MKKFYMTIAACLLMTITLNAQENLKPYRLIIGNGGEYGNPGNNVTVASYLTESQDYNVFDGINSQSIQSICLDSSYAYVLAQDSIIKYSLENQNRVAATKLTALRDIEQYGENLIITRQFPADDSCVYVLKKTDLSVTKIVQTPGETGGIAIVGDSAYIAVPGPYGTSQGKLVVMNLYDFTISKEMNFGSSAKGLSEVFYKEPFIYTVNTHFWDMTNLQYSVSEYNIENGDTATHVFNGDYYGFTGHPVMKENEILIPRSMDIAAFNTETSEITSYLDRTIAAMCYDSVDKKLYLTTSDFSSYGKMYIYNTSSLSVEDSLDVGVSPEALAIQYTVDNTSINNTGPKKKISLYPNPAINTVHFKDNKLNGEYSVKIFNVAGEELVNKNLQKGGILDVSNLTNGVYIVQIITAKETYVTKLLKQ